MTAEDWVVDKMGGDPSIEVIVTSVMWTELHSHLIRRPGSVSGQLEDEQVAFVLAAHNITTEKVRLVGHELILAGPDDLEYQSRAGIGLNGQFVARALTRCNQEGWSLIEVHSHPFDSSYYTTFSGIDWNNDQAKMPRLAEMFPHPFHHATMVVGQKSLDAHFYDRESGSIRPIQKVTIVGCSDNSNDIIRVLSTTSCPPQTDAITMSSRHERQVPLIGADTQAVLPKVSIVVVGLGGLGSFASLELAHLGVGKLILIDPDSVETTNLNRLLGARVSDVGRQKVDVFRELIKEISPTTTVTALAASVLEPAAIHEAKGADIILGCVDNHGARLVLNHVAVRYIIPLIDAGTGARVTEGATPSQLGGQVQIVGPGLGCLECHGFIDPQRAAFDLATPEMQAYERAHGYGTEDPAPSVIFLNGVVASMQVAEAIRILSPTLQTRLPFQTMVIYDALARKSFAATSRPSFECVTCGADGVTGVADLAPIQTQSSDPQRREGVIPRLTRL